MTTSLPRTRDLLPRIQQLSANLTKAMLNHCDKKIKIILQTLQAEIKDIKNIPNCNLITKVNKLSQHRDYDIRKLSKSLLFTNTNKPKSETTLYNYYKIKPSNNKLELKCNNDIKNNTKSGIVYIASMQRTEKWPEIRDKNGKLIKRINVTSGSNNKIEGESAKQVSPMNLGPINKELFNKLNIFNSQNDDEEAILFENYWQYGKIFKDLGHLNNKTNKYTNKWLKFRKKGYLLKKGHRHPNGTKTNEILYKYKKGNK
eukprot:553163_1